jgi:hypothetical protein
MVVHGAGWKAAPLPVPTTAERLGVRAAVPDDLGVRTAIPDVGSGLPSRWRLRRRHRSRSPSCRRLPGARGLGSLESAASLRVQLEVEQSGPYAAVVPALMFLDVV